MSSTTYISQLSYVAAMDFYRNVSVSGGLPSEYQPEQVLSKQGGLSTTLDDLFPAHNTEGDISLEWLSIFVEDCLSSTGNCLPVPTNLPNNSNTTIPKSPLKLQNPHQKPHQNPSPLQTPAIPCKARSKRKRIQKPKLKPPSTTWSTLHMVTSDPPLLDQAYWLADSELVEPKKGVPGATKIGGDRAAEVEEEEEEKEEGLEAGGSNNGQPRRCSHCLAQRTPQWRAGPMGPKTLCNACGVRYKSGRLLPEYRPAKSPTFVSYKHSNSHKKVMEMRLGILSSVNGEQ